MTSKLSFIIENLWSILILSLIIIVFIVIYERNNKNKIAIDEKIKKENWLSSMDLKASRIQYILAVVVLLFIALLQK